MNKLLPLLVATLINIGSKGQSNSGKIEQIIPCIAFIVDTASNTSGTGFFVLRGVDYYLITAEHVAKSMFPFSTHIGVNLANNSSIFIPINHILDSQSYDYTKIKWTTHPHADISVIKLNFNKIKDTLGIDFLLYEEIEDVLKDPLRDRYLTVYGFPLNLGVGNKISPISKKYSPASGIMDFMRFDTSKASKFFLIDDPSISGMSGGPVVAMPQQLIINDTPVTIQQTWVIGLVHGTINAQGGGYGAIVPAKFIVETLDSAPSSNGSYLFQYPNGNKWSEVIIKNGLFWEVLYNNDPQGNPQEKGSLKNGNGTRYIYDYDGKKLAILHIKNGKIYKTE